MDIYVLRHTQTDSNKGGILGDIHEDINETGIKQAEDIGKEIVDMKFDLIISSPSIRTKHVVKIINTQNIPVIYDDRLIERDLGVCQYSSWDDIDKIDFWNYYPKKYLELESIKELCERVKEFIDEIKNKYPDKKMLFVTHGGVTRGFYFYSFGMPEDGDFRDCGQKNSELKKYEV